MKLQSISYAFISILLIFATAFSFSASTIQLVTASSENFYFNNIIHKLYNAYLIWPINWSNVLNSYINLNIDLLLLINLVTIYFASVFLIKILKQNDELIIYITASIFTITLFLLWSNDLILLSSIAWTLILTVSYYFTLTLVNNVIRNILLSLLLTFTSIFFLGLLNILAIALAVVLASIIKKTTYKDFPILRDKKDSFFLVFVILISVVSYLFLPDIHFPNYSSVGHLVSDDGLPGNILPFFGNTPNIPIINRENLKQSLYLLVNIQLVISFLSYIFIKKNTLNKLVLIISIFCWLDIVPIEDINQISPLASISRIIPVLFLFPVTPILCALNLLLISLLLLIYSNKNYHGCIALLILLSTTFVNKKIILSQAGYLYQNFSNNIEIEFLNLPREKQKKYLPYLVSTSFIVLDKIGFWPLEIADTIKSYRFSSLIKHNPALLASTNQSEINNLVDRNIATRWSPSNAKQIGSEWFHLYFNTPLTIHGLELDSGPFFTDFARGLEIRAKDSCLQPATIDPNNTDYKLLFKEPKWEGSLTFTSDNYPYFEGQASGRIYFKENKVVQCLLVKQIGQNNNYDWSVAELKFLY
jgi:hypothetical protein